MCKNINEKCGNKVEANATKLTKPRLIVFCMPAELSVENTKEAILIQNVEISLKDDDLTPKCIFKDRKENKNLIILGAAEETHVFRMASTPRGGGWGISAPC